MLIFNSSCLPPTWQARQSWHIPARRIGYTQRSKSSFPWNLVSFTVNHWEGVRNTAVTFLANKFILPAGLKCLYMLKIAWNEVSVMHTRRATVQILFTNTDCKCNTQQSPGWWYVLEPGEWCYFSCPRFLSELTSALTSPLENTLRLLQSLLPTCKEEELAGLIQGMIPNGFGSRRISFGTTLIFSFPSVLEQGNGHSLLFP